MLMLFAVKVTNKNCLEMTNERITLYAKIIRRITSFFGYIMRIGSLENNATTGKINS